MATVGFRGLGRSVAFASAAFLGGAGFTAGVRAALNAASNLNEQINKSNVIFGQSAERIEAFSRRAADGLGLSTRAALEASGQFGAMFTTLGLGQREMAAMSTRLVTLGADLASFANEDPSDMLDRLRSGLAGEAEPLRRFGILLSEARVKQEAYRTGLAKVGDELTEQQKVQARYSLILQDSATAQGDFARTSDSFANAQRRLRANVENLSAQIGGVLLPVFARATGGLSDFLSRLGQSQDFQRFLQTAQSAVERFSAAIAERIPQVQRIVGAIFDPLRDRVLPIVLDVAAIIGRTWSNIVDVFDANSGRLRNILTDVGTILQNVWTVARPTIVFLFEKALPTAIGIALPILEKIIDVARVMSEVFVRTVTVIVRSLDTFLGGLSLVADAASHLPFIGDHFKGVSDKINAAREDLRKFADDLDALNNKEVRVNFIINRQASTGATLHALGGPGQPAEDVEEETKATEDALEAQQRGAQRIQDAAATATTKTKTALTAAEKQRNQFEKLLGALAIRGDAAAQTRRLADDLRVNRETEQLLLQQIRVEGRTNELVGQLQEIRQERTQLEREQRQGRQLRALGLTAEGERRVPSVEALQKRLGTLREQIKGTVLDTQNTRQQLARIARVLSGQFGAVGRDVRESILAMFREIAGALDQGGKQGPLTRTRGLNTSKIAEGLGLSPEQERELRSRLSSFNTAGRALARTVPRGAPLATAGFGGGLAGALIVEAHTTINLDGQKVASVVTRNQQKANRRNPRQKRGPNRIGGR